MIRNFLALLGFCGFCVPGWALDLRIGSGIISISEAIKQAKPGNTIHLDPATRLIIRAGSVCQRERHGGSADRSGWAWVGN